MWVMATYWKLFGLRWHILAAVAVLMLLMVGCGKDTQREALETKVAKLEARLAATEWTEEEAISVVKQELSKDPASLLRFRGRDLALFYRSESTARYLLQSSVPWSAYYEPSSFRWRVEGGFPSYSKRMLLPN